MNRLGGEPRWRADEHRPGHLPELEGRFIAIVEKRIDLGAVRDDDDRSVVEPAGLRFSRAPARQQLASHDAGKRIEEEAGMRHRRRAPPSRRAPPALHFPHADDRLDLVKRQPPGIAHWQAITEPGLGERADGEAGESQRRGRIDRHLESDLLELGQRQQRRHSAGEHVGQLRERHLAGDASELLDRLWRLDKAQIDPCLGISIRPIDRAVEPFAGAGVGPREDHEVAISASVERGMKPIEHRGHRHDLLAGEVPAALRLELILDEDPRGPGRLELFHRPGDTRAVAMAGITVGNQWDRHPGRDPAHTFGHLRCRQQPEVGKAMRARCGAKAAEEEHFGTGLLDDAGREGIMRHQRPHEAGAGQEGAESGGGSRRHGDRDGEGSSGLASDALTPRRRSDRHSRRASASLRRGRSETSRAPGGWRSPCRGRGSRP